MATGLLLIDIQNDYFPGGAMELVGMEVASVEAAGLLRAFRERGAPIYHVQHFSVRPGSTFFVPDTSGVEIHSAVTPQSSESVTPKNFPNAFRETDLAEKLHKDGVSAVTVCGAMSHMCIDASARAAFDLGFEVSVASDACATRDLTFEGRTLAAADVHASFMSALSAPYATVASARELLG